MSILSLFCEIDAFFLAHEKWHRTPRLPEATPIETRGHPRSLHPSEVMTILIALHQSGYRTFNHFLGLTHQCFISQEISVVDRDIEKITHV